MAKMSFRDPGTDVLKAYGYMESNDPGDISQEEADDFALTPGQWFWDVTDAWAPYVPTPPANGNGFLLALRAEMTLADTNALLVTYPAAFHAIQLQQWQDFIDMVVLAHTDTAIDDTLYTTIQTLAETYHIPITLPALP